MSRYQTESSVCGTHMVRPFGRNEDICTTFSHVRRRTHEPGDMAEYTHGLRVGATPPVG